jgi:hypothetical protein
MWTPSLSKAFARVGQIVSHQEQSERDPRLVSIHRLSSSVIVEANKYQASPLRSDLIGKFRVFRHSDQQFDMRGCDATQGWEINEQANENRTQS